MIVENIESLGAYFDIDVLFDAELLLDRKVGIAERRTPNAADARAGTQVKPVETRGRLKAAALNAGRFTFIDPHDCVSTLPVIAGMHAAWNCQGTPQTDESRK